MNQNDRSSSLDTDLFQNRPFHTLLDFSELSERFRPAVKAEMERSISEQRRQDLQGVLDYLAEQDLHDSEGRDLGYDKRSFSRTELRVAAKLWPSQTVKYLLYRYRFNHYPRHNCLSEYPILLAIEPTSVCNIRCTMCFQVDEELSLNRDLMGFMKFDLYRRIIDESVANDLSAVVLASRGEPLLHTDIFRMIKYAKACGILDVKLNTNVTRLTPERSRALLESAPDTLVFSVDASLKEDFERIRVGAKFDKIVENIESFNEIRRKEFPDCPTRTRVSMVLLDEGQDVENAMRFWKEMVDEFAFRWAIPRVRIYRQLDHAAQRPCSLLWERLYIWWDGTVNPCDEDYLSKLSPGKLDDETTIKQLWQGDKMQQYRRQHLSQAKNQLHPCDKCPGF